MNNNPAAPVHALSYALLLQLALRMMISIPSEFLAEGIVLLICETVLGIVSFVLPATVFFRISGFRSDNFISFKINFPPQPFFSACTVLAVIIAAGTISDKLVLLLGNWGWSLRENAPVIKDATAAYYIIFFIATVPIAALTEEYFYRGIVLNSLTRYNKIFALIFQSVLFGFLHGNPKQFLYAVCGGLFLGILTLECGSVIFAVFVHMANNALVFLTLHFDLFRQVQTAVFAILFAGGLFGLLLIIRRMKNKTKQPVPFGKLVRLFMMSPPMIGYFIIKIMLLPGWFKPI
ncbi:MAG: CPBP family intramembrane glutamic endopeptidase [Eubacteriales bacterium]